MSAEALAKSLKMELDDLQRLLDAAERKQLLVRQGDRYRLHFQNPIIKVRPETKMTQWLVTKPYRHTVRVPRRYSVQQVQDTIRAAFGKSFVIREWKEVYLPVYSIDVQNPDNSIATYKWNALNGKRLPMRYVY